MKDKTGKRLKYSNRKDSFRNKRFKIQKNIEKYKKDKNITEVENNLSNYNSKSVNIKKFSEYILNKNKINN
jgi:hypothetical protein